MKTVLQMNYAINSLCSSLGLPECYVKTQHGILYLVSPCGEPFAKLVNLATKTVNTKDVEFIFKKVEEFLKNNLDELKTFFEAKKLRKELDIRAIAKDAGFYSDIYPTFLKLGLITNTANNSALISNITSEGTFNISKNITEEELKLIPKELKELKKRASEVFKQYKVLQEASTIVDNFVKKHLNCN